MTSPATHDEATGSLDEDYCAMAADADREAEADLWCEALIADVATDLTRRQATFMRVVR